MEFLLLTILPLNEVHRLKPNTRYLLKPVSEDGSVDWMKIRSLAGNKRKW